MTKRIALYSSLAFASVLAVSGCGGSGTVTPELIRLTNARAEKRTPSTSLRASGVNVNSNLTISVLKVPITAVKLTDNANGDGGEEIYACSGSTAADCLVDLASANELENLLTGASAKSIGAGTYTFVKIDNCLTGSTTEAKIKASGTTDPGLTGSTLYTQAGDGALTTDASLWGEATVYFNGCSRQYPLPTPVTVAKGDSISVKLYFDIRDIAFFGDAANAGTGGNGDSAWYSGGSSYVYPSNPPGTYVGVNYLDVAGTVDSGTPTIERFRVDADTGELGTIGLLYTSSGAYFGGFSRSYYSAATTNGHNRFVTSLQTFTDNGDGTFTIANFGSASTGPGYFNASTFVKSTSATPRPYTEASGPGGTYTIEALP